MLFTKNTSDFPKKARVVGSNNLKINNNMATDIMLAIKKFLKLIL